MISNIESAISDIRNGKLIIVVDDEDRENEGDLICAAETITPDVVNFMATHGRGLICTPIEDRRAEDLQLPLMVSNNTALHETAFTVSVDLMGHGCSTGISTYDRALTIQALALPEFNAGDFARPGHIFPLRAKPGGVLRRTGHTEATVDLSRLAGLRPAGALVEILNDDGSMARMQDLVEKAVAWNLKMITIRDLVEYRLKKEKLVTIDQEWHADSEFGPLHFIVFKQLDNGIYHVAIRCGKKSNPSEDLIRVQYCDAMSELIDYLGRSRQSSLYKLLNKLQGEGGGLLLIIQNPEKNVHPLAKIADKHLDQHTTSHADLRDIGIGAQILRELGVQKMHLITNHPKKLVGLEGYGLQILSHREMN